MTRNFTHARSVNAVVAADRRNQGLFFISTVRHHVCTTSGTPAKGEEYKACVSKLSAMRLVAALTACLLEKAQAFGGEVLPAAVVSEVVSHSMFPSVTQPNAAVEAL